VFVVIANIKQDFILKANGRKLGVKVSNYYLEDVQCKTCGGKVIADDRSREGYYAVCENKCHESPLNHKKHPDWVEKIRGKK